MGQLAVYGLLAIVIAGVLFLVATRFLPAGEQIAPPLRDEQPWNLPPDRELRAEDIDSVRLPVSLRGYRFAETDILLDRLAGELRSRDLEIARLRGQDGSRAVGEHSPLTFARPKPAVPEAPEPEPGSWAPAEVGPADAGPPDTSPQPPPSDDREQPVTDTPAVPADAAGDDDRR